MAWSAQVFAVVVLAVAASATTTPAGAAPPKVVTYPVPPGQPLPWKIILQGVDPEHMVENVIFDNVSCFGQVITADSPGVTVGAHTRNVTFMNGPPASR